VPVGILPLEAAKVVAPRSLVFDILIGLGPSAHRLVALLRFWLSDRARVLEQVNRLHRFQPGSRRQKWDSDAKFPGWKLQASGST